MDAGLHGEVRINCTDGNGQKMLLRGTDFEELKKVMDFRRWERAFWEGKGHKQSQEVEGCSEEV